MTNDKDGAALLRDPLLDALKKSRELFERYGKEHRAKAENHRITDRFLFEPCRSANANASDRKAETNEAMVAMIDAALQSHGQAFDAAGVREAFDAGFGAACAAVYVRTGETPPELCDAEFDKAWDIHVSNPIPEAPASVEPDTPEIEQVYIAQGINADGGPPWNWYVVGPDGEVAYCQTEDGENHAHMIAAALNDRVHILREDLKKYQAEPDTIGSHFGNGGGLDPVERVFEPYPGAFDRILGPEDASHDQRGGSGE